MPCPNLQVVLSPHKLWESNYDLDIIDIIGIQCSYWKFIFHLCKKKKKREKIEKRKERKNRKERKGKNRKRKRKEGKKI